MGNWMKRGRDGKRLRLCLTLGGRGGSWVLGYLNKEDRQKLEQDSRNSVGWNAFVF